MLVPGGLNVGLLVRLNASARNSMRTRSLTWKCLNKEKSRFLNLSARRINESRIPIRVIGRNHERRLIKPVANRGIGKLAGADAVWQLAADAGVRNIAGNRRRERQAAVQHHDALHLPAAQHRVCKAVGVRQEPSVSPERQLIARADRQILRNVEGSKRLLVRVIASRGRRVLHEEVLRIGIRNQIPKSRCGPLFVFHLQSVVNRRGVLRVVSDRPEQRVRPACLDRARTRRRIVNRVAYRTDSRPCCRHNRLPAPCCGPTPAAPRNSNADRIPSAC